ncbi:MAG TPA: hypothetical protein DHU96_25245 [Actinobacteria bacterium]|nr:hypothetical protein [Actinomycetota bacterium]
MDDICLHVEAADQATLRRTLRAVLDQLNLLNQIAAAGAAIGQSTKHQAHDRYTATVQAATAPGSTGPASQACAADFGEAYFAHLGFVCGASHIGYCVHSVTTAIACGLGLSGWPTSEGGYREPGSGT